MMRRSDFERRGGDEEYDYEDESEVSHELPRGALLITIGYLTILTILWLQVYLQLLSSGGIPQR